MAYVHLAPTDSACEVVNPFTMIAEATRKNDRTRKRLHTEDSAKGVLDSHFLPDDQFDSFWNSIKIADDQRNQLLAQAVLNFTLRPRVDPARVPLHGIILLVGPPGTGKTSLARGLASRTAASVTGLGEFVYLEVEPHSLTSSSHGKSQKAVQELLGQTIAEIAAEYPLIVLLDEVETLAADRARMSLEANPIDVHRATDAVLAQLDHLAAHHKNLLFVATSNFPQAIDEAFMSRADLVMNIGLPNADARAQILRDTLAALQEVFPKLDKLIAKLDWKKLVQITDGLDGRRLRKAVVSACSLSKETALDIEKLTAADLKTALNDAVQAVRENEKLV